MSGAYYNEIDQYAAAWLRELIKRGVIADGDVDERDIRQVEPADVRGYTQCHWFAGIGVWSHALRNAGWPDDLATWSGSCPCQGFSASGKREGFSDQRHLWPTWFRLILECGPHTIFGEQVAGKDGLAWFDVVSSDLEGEGYAIGAADTCAAGFGAPHIRQRLYFVADAECEITERRRYKLGRAATTIEGQKDKREWIWNEPLNGGNAGGTVDESSGSRCEGNGLLPLFGEGPRGQSAPRIAGSGAVDELGDALQPRLEGHKWDERDGNQPGRLIADSPGLVTAPGVLNGFWADAEWLWCRDGKMRPVESGTPPLATGITSRVGRLRGYGNALCSSQAEAFIEAYLDVLCT